MNPSHKLKEGVETVPNFFEENKKSPYGEYLPVRGLSIETLKKFGARTNPDTGEFFFDFYTYGTKELGAVKKRTTGKDFPFFFKNNKTFNQLSHFGANLFSGGKYITVTEGEFDAMSAFEMNGSSFPVVSVKNGVSTKYTQEDINYLEGFERVYVCFDADEPGKLGAEHLAQSLSKNKAYIVKLDPKLGKDANDYLQKKLFKEFNSAWWAAKPYAPDDLIFGSDTLSLIEDTEEASSIPYPWEGLNDLLHGARKGELVVVTAGSGTGKCFGKGTPVIKYDGTIIPVEEVRDGDVLLGPDSRKRVVSGTIKGYGGLYLIEQLNGNSYVVNEEHILCIWNCKRNKYVNISVKDFLQSSSTFIKVAKGYKSTCVSFQKGKEKLYIDPYWFGLWLGDGISANTGITTRDKEIIEYIKRYSVRLDLYPYVYEDNYYLSSDKGNSNPIVYFLNKWDIKNNKHIPHHYKIASEQDRLLLLAGLLDSDGHLCNGLNTFEITQKNKRLSKDIIFLARSLGFSVSCTTCLKSCQTGAVGEYERMFISGDVNRVPTKLKRKQATERKQIKNVLHTGIKVSYVGKGDYFGFCVDKDHKFLLEDFTVVHNSETVREIALNVRKTTNEKIGLIFLEESLKRTVETLVGMELGKNLRLPENQKTPFEEKQKAWEALFKDDEERIVFWKHFGSNTIEKVVSTIRYMAVNFGARFIVLDHISIIVSGQQLAGGDERRTFDLIMTELRTLVQELDISLFLVSHLKRPDGTPHEEGAATSLAQLRGSGAIGHLADIAIGLERNGQAEDPWDRNVTTIRVLKNRFTGETGPACKVVWHRDTGRLEEVTRENEEDIKQSFYRKINYVVDDKNEKDDV